MYYEGDVPYTVVIDTDSYAGNFEREMVAYITGHWDEYVGEDQAKVFQKEIPKENDWYPFDDVCIDVIGEHDGYGTRNVAGIDNTGPNGLYNSVSFFFEKRPDLELISLIKERAYKFTKEGSIHGRPQTMKIIGFRLLKKTVLTVIEHI